MIRGVVNADLEAVISLTLRGPGGHEHTIDTIVDTGFNGFLTLPPALVQALGLTRVSRGRALLANGSLELFDIHGVTVIWEDKLRYVEADAVDAPPLVGMSLLEGYDLSIRVAAGGDVVIQAEDEREQL
jgi:clan AA aspartic protease